MNAKANPKRTIMPRKKDSPDSTIGDGSLLSVAYMAADLRTKPPNALKILRRLKCPLVRIGNRLFATRGNYHASLTAGEIDPNVTPSRDKKRA